VNRDPWAWRIDSGGFLGVANRRIASVMVDEDGIRQRWASIGCKLDERGRRLFAAAEVEAAGYGALAIVSKITGIARSTINRGEDDLGEGPLPDGRVRRKGGGGKPLIESDPTLASDLRNLVEPATLGSPVQPLLWVSKSREKLARALVEMGHAISANTVGKLLTTELGFSRQHNRKADEGSKHPDRDAQFAHINTKVVAAQAKRQPVISVDTKKKELVGNYRNGGCDYRPKGEPRRVNVHDYEDKRLGKVVPYGVYDVTANAAVVSVGITADTAEFAVQAIRCWLERMGWQRYPQARELTITAELRRLQRCARAALESRAAKARRRDGPRAARPSLSARNIEVEQDRAPPVLPHHPELAWTTVDRSLRRRGADQCDHDQGGLEGRVRARHPHLRERHQGARCRDGRPGHHRRPVPS
jgi:hypothetical protein